MASKLFEKIILNNNVEIQNRLAIAPLTLYCSDENGAVFDEEREYLKLRGTNIGLYILGATIISKESLPTFNFPIAIDEKNIPALEERAKIIKDQGAKAIAQINHAGSFGLNEKSGLNPVVPSKDIAIEDAKNRGLNFKDFHELTNDEINKIIEKFTYAAELCIKSGYDGIEIHGANNFLIQQFYSPHTNKRTDEWGGSDENRMKFALKIVDSIVNLREKYKKPEFIIGYRLSPEEPFEDGITMTETMKLVKALIQKNIQYIHVSQKDFFKKSRRGEGAGIERLKLIHDETKGKVALIGVGGIKSEKDFINAVNSDFAEFIGVGQASMMNKDLGIILKEGKGDKLNLELDPEKPELYSIPSDLWKMCISGIDWLPPVKGKSSEKK